MDDQLTNTQPHKSKNSALLWVYSSIALVTVSIVILLGYVIYSGTRIANVHSRLINMSMQIKLETAIAHLWFEEIISGDSTTTIDEVLQHVDNADHYTKVMLEGGQFNNGRIIAVKDLVLRKYLENVCELLGQFRAITLERWQAKEIAGVGTDIDQKYDGVFAKLIDQADKAQNHLHGLIKSELLKFRSTQLTLVMVCIGLALLVAVIIGKFMRHNIKDDMMLRKINEDLAESEEKFRNVAEQSVVAFVIVQDQKFKYVNQAVSEILEYSPEEMTSWSASNGYSQIVHQDDLAFVVEQQRRINADDSRVFKHFAFKVWTKSRRLRCLDSFWSKITLQGRDATLITLIDITERDKAEEALKRSQKQYSELVDSVDGIIWECDAKTYKFSFVSKEAERLIGYPCERWTKETTFWKDHIHPDDRDWAVNFCVNATKQKQNHQFEYRMIASDGRVVWLRDIVHVIVENGEPSKLRGVMIDITQSKTAEPK